MAFMREQYGKSYKPNTRESVRKDSMAQFVFYGFAVANPDKPGRPNNDRNYAYQVEKSFLALVQTYGTPEWETSLLAFKGSRAALRERLAGERKKQLIQANNLRGGEIELSPGGQNELIKEVLEKFCPRFTPGATLLAVGDADQKRLPGADERLKKLNIHLPEHGKMPDVIVYYEAKHWVVVIEAVVSHGPIDLKRREELRAMFAASAAPLVYVTAFMTRATAARYLSKIAWETEVWVAEAPSHMIHYNGERFLGPHPE